MTAAEMSHLFLVLYDKITNFAAPGYEPEEIDLFLNKAQLEFVKTRYNPKGNQYNDGLEATEKRRKDLSELYRTVDLPGGASNPSDQSGVSVFGEFFDLPIDFMYTLNEEIIGSSRDICLNNLRIKVKPVTHDEYMISRENPFKKPTKDRVWRMDYSRDLSQGPTNNSKRHEIITFQGLAVQNYIVRYIKVPINIDTTNSITSELNPEVHSELVDIAVRMAAGITDASTYQIKMQEQKGGE